MAAFSLSAAAQDALYVPGAIPLEYSRRPATDLFYKGKNLTPDELIQLRKQGIDLSDINPDDKSEIWHNELGRPLDPKLDHLELDLNREVEFIATIPSSLGNFWFTVKQQDESGNTRIFRVFLSKTAHARLLRKNLLRKLGYQVPKTMYAAHLSVKMKGEFSRKTFLDTLAKSTFGEPERWVTNASDIESPLVQLQDVIVYDANEDIYNLSHGIISGADHIRGRRIFNSLIIPYSLVNVQETVNGFSWNPGRTFNNFVLLNIDYANEFSTPLEDALWILKRISKLTRADYEEIVKYSYFPPEVAALLVEKIIARRNWLTNVFPLHTPEMNFNSQISQLPNLENGELKKERWDGHAARYAYSDPESPLSKEEIAAFFKAKGISAIIESLASRFDNAFLKGTDIQRKVIEKQYEAAKKQFINLLKTGKFKRVPFGLFAFPTIDGEIWVSRDIVAGQYMGVDNAIQLADNFEMSVTPGVFAGAVGMPTGFQLQLGAQLKFSRSFTHLRNIKSIRKALKEPFKNLFVSMLKKEYGHMFDELLTDSYTSQTPEEKEKKLVEIMAKFNESMGTGDSFIISNNISQNNFSTLAYSMSKSVSMQASLYASQISIGRLHILKKSDTEIHIYRDYGDMNIKGVNFGVKALIPIVSVTFDKANGKAKTKFYSLDLNPKINENKDIESNLFALRQIFIENSFELLNKLQKPYVIHHNFKEKTSNISLLFLNDYHESSMDTLNVTLQDGYEKKFVWARSGTREGPDYQGLTVDLINAWVKDTLKFDNVSVPNPGSGDPGDTFKGHSANRTTSFQAEVNSVKDNSSPIINPFFNVLYRWKGWKISRDKMFKLIDSVNEKFNYPLFSHLDFQNAENFQLYAIDVNLNIYEQGLSKLANTEPRYLENLLNNEGKFPPVYGDPSSRGPSLESKRKQQKLMYIRRTIEKLKSFNQFLALGSSELAAEAGNDYVSLLEYALPLNRLVELVGGPDNLFIYGNVTAFRESDENGDLPVQANSPPGRYGEEHPRGSLYDVQSYIGLAPAEFYIHWLLRDP